nr:nucleolar G-protein [Cryptomonas sp.]
MFSVIRSKDLIDVILSKTQRKTPTIIHQQLSIQRIRKFYIRKVKFVQQKFENYIYQIIKNFPVIDQIHHFYHAMFNILFNRDYYKISLSRLNNFKIIVGKISANYIKLLKHGDSLYTCKHLKKIALGRICTMIKKLDRSFIYLEKVRIQIKNIPLIDPYRKSILITGYSNSGKSSLMNKITRANVLVNSANYTTKTLQVGHLMQNFVRWQVIDTPGIMKSSLSKYNSIEIQTINAYIHLDCVAIHIFDPSYSDKQKLSDQIDQFRSFSVLTKTKKKIFLLGKVDLEWEKTKDRQNRASISLIFKLYPNKSEIFKISTHDEVGLLSLCQSACSLNNDISRKKIKRTIPHSYIWDKLEFSCNNLKTIQNEENLSGEIARYDYKQRHYYPITADKLLNHKSGRKSNSVISNELKNKEREEKLREFIYEEKYVYQDLRHYVLVQKSTRDMVFLFNNTIALNSTSLEIH